MSRMTNDERADRFDAELVAAVAADDSDHRLIALLGRPRLDSYERWTRQFLESSVRALGQPLKDGLELGVDDDPDSSLRADRGELLIIGAVPPAAAIRPAIVPGAVVS